MTQPVLELSDLSVAAGDKVICRNINLVINEGETHVLIGPNGSGKSSLLCALMGIEPFRITGGTARFAGRDIADLSITERAQAGIGMAFQHPPVIDGVTVRKLMGALRIDDELEAQATALSLSHLLDRDINAGFSGGELKRSEVLKLMLQQPRLCLFDEPESGVDFEHVQVVGRAVRELLSTPNDDGSRRSALIITHTGFILDNLGDATGHLMREGTICRSGDAREMTEAVRRTGYSAA